MIFITTLFKKNLMLNCYLLTQTVLLMKQNQKMFMKNFCKWKDLFDFSNYLKDSKFFDETYKKNIGKMKDEFGRVILDEFVGLKSKMYSIKKIDGKESSSAKGVNIATEINEFKDVLFHKKVIRQIMGRIQVCLLR